MTDLISREAAIALIEALPPEWARKGSMAEFNQVTIKQVREALTNMPSAKLTPKHKDWVPIP